MADVMVIKKYPFILWLILMLSNRFCYLLPEYFGTQVISCSNFLFVFAILFSFLTVNKFKRHVKKYDYSGLIAIGLLLSITSAYQASTLYSGQSFLDGLSCSKYMIVGLLMYFPIVALLKAEKLSFDDIVKVFWICAVSQMFVFFIQYIVGPSHVFLSVYYTTPAVDSRVSRIRLYGNTYTILISLIFAVNRICQRKNKKGDYAYLVAAIAYAVIINKSREYIVSTIVIILVGFVFAKTKSYKKMFIYVALIIVASNLLTTEFVQGIVYELTHTTLETNSTLAVRLRGQSLYLDALKEHPLLGGGYADVSIDSAARLSGYTLGYFIADNGVLGYLFRYGYLGLLLIVPVIAVFFINGLRLRKSGDVVVLMELSTLFVGVINNSRWYDGMGLFYTFIFIIYIEYERWKAKQYVSLSE